MNIMLAEVLAQALSQKQQPGPAFEPGSPLACRASSTASTDRAPGMADGRAQPRILKRTPAASHRCWKSLGWHAGEEDRSGSGCHPSPRRSRSIRVAGDEESCGQWVYLYNEATRTSPVTGEWFDHHRPPDKTDRKRITWATSTGRRTTTW